MRFPIPSTARTGVGLASTGLVLALALALGAPPAFAHPSPAPSEASIHGALAGPDEPILPAVPQNDDFTQEDGFAQEDPFLGFRIDDEENRILLEIPRDRLDTDFLYMNTLATGLGAGQPLLDRGQVGMEAVVRLEHRGGRVLMIRDNWGVRAVGGDDALERSVRESFPTSVIGSFPLEEDEGDEETLVVDASSFFLSDVFGIIQRVRGADQGTFQLARDRSWISPESSGAFPMNTEIRSVLTFTSDEPGVQIRQSAPDGNAITLEQHHSLVALPDDEGFRPRPHDGRSGLFSASFYDFAQGVDGNYQGGHTARWRLIPSDTEAYLAGELVEPEEPIVYYMDPGIPEPYRTAFIEGGMWWNEIFEAAGFRNAFQIRDLPADANPLDARYNMIYWVHRRGPGPSVGPSFRDPRTGEILNTVVRMDSWRSLVNYNIWAGFRPAASAAGLNVDAEEFAMARRRQHTAHEIGHTVGVAHNFIAATQGRSSVMDYPAPLVDLGDDGELDLSQAYRDAGGAWDSLAVRYAYTWFPDEATEREGLEEIISDALDQGLRFITGGHAAQSGSIPGATQWIEGSTMMEALERTTRVRELLVERFNEEAIDPGEPMSLLNQRFAHVYLHHRYALEGTIKYVGGMDFTYALRGDGQTPAQILPASEQRQALEMVLDALEPEALAIPDHLPDLIPPSGYGSDGSEIWMPSRAGTAFDPLTLAGGLATEVVENLLHRERLARVASFHARDGGNPSLDEVLGRVMERSWGASESGAGGPDALRRIVQRVVLNTLLDRAGDTEATPEVRAAAEYHLESLREELAGTNGATPESRAHLQTARLDLARYFAGEDDPDARSRWPVVPLPWP